MPGSFNSKKTEAGDMYTFIRQLAKKVFSVSLALYFITLFLSQFEIASVTTFINKNLLLGLILTGFVFTISFTTREDGKGRISRSDWALIGLLACIGVGLNVLLINENGTFGILASFILLLFASGLGLYLWSGKDDEVKFILFGRDRRYKAKTYVQSSWKQWLVSLLIIILILIINSIVNNNASTTPPAVKTTTPTPLASPTQTVQPTLTLAPSATPTPQASPTPTPVPLSSLPSEYNVYILNGSGVPGAASDMRALLEQHSIAVRYTGDANNYNYTETVIKYNQAFESVADATYQILSAQYQPLTKVLFTPGELYSQYDVVIIHGQ